jgi:phage terminase small subunit
MIQFPQVAIYRNLLVSMQRYEQEFGMTPASRTRISIKDEASADDDGGFDFEVPPLRLAK